MLRKPVSAKPRSTAASATFAKAGAHSKGIAPKAKPAAAKSGSATLSKVKSRVELSAPGSKDAGSTPAGTDKTPKRRKPKLLHAGFTIPKDEYAAIDTLKQRAVVLRRPAKKSELLRAGLKLMLDLEGPALLGALRAVPAIKTGRPKGAHK